MTTAHPAASSTGAEINPAQVRYIKLGRGGMWEKECVEKGIVRYGFDSASADRFPLCCGRKWDELRASFLADSQMNEGTATRFTNETRLFFEDDGSTLWITFVGEKLYWGFLTPDPPQRHSDGDGVWRTVKGGWKWKAINGDSLTKDRLWGALTKLASYRGTSCRVDVEKYVTHRINGKKTDEVENALAAIEALKTSVQKLLKKLGPDDFETLVDLVFTSSGWRRLGRVGGTQKTIDLDIELPTTKERAFVQVKTRTTTAELEEYIDKFKETDLYDRMFYVYHSGPAATDGDDSVTIIGPDRLADMVLDAGLVNWLVRKVS